VLLAGGGDINPIWYGQEPEIDQLYGIDDLQDENDFSIAKYALDSGIPVLAICRGCQIVNVLKGGSLVQHMDKDHRHHVHTIHLDRDAAELGLTKPDLEASCFHHQAIDKLGDDLEVIARAQEGHIEAFKINAKVWSYGFQWHPEDNSTTVDQQHELFVRFVSEAAKN
jgi:putative glutamine amidotransferase